ncbi:MAG: calcium/proton exchanger [Gemmatimonadota bacterium]
MTISEQLRADAATLALALEADFVGTEHLFLAWLETASGPGADAMRSAGLTPDAFRTLLASGKQRRRSSGPVASPGELSSQGQRVMELALELATAEGRSEPDLDDIMLAMIREPRGALARAMSEFQLKPSKLRALIRPGSTEADRPEAPERPKREPAGSTEPAAEVVERPAREPREPREPKAKPKPKPREPEPSTETRPPARPRRDAETDDIPFARAPERPRLTPPPKPPRVEPSAPASQRVFGPMSILLLAIPLAIWLAQRGGDPVAIFAMACIAILPLAGLMGTATEHLADRTGPTLGGLLNATFGNAAELIIALIALRAGYVDLVKASITGSILGNLLLILGLALLVGGSRRSMLSFSRTNASMGAAMLALAVAGLAFPALFQAVHPGAALGIELHLSELVAVVLAVTYGFSLLFSLRTHKALFGGHHGGLDGPAWGVGKAILILAAATVGVAGMSELLVGEVGAVTASLGLSETFLGLILIPIIGNAAEHATAITVARKGQTDLALQIALGSSTQVALLVAPILVFAGAAFGVAGMNLVFTSFEVVALGLAVLVTSLVTLDGESNWFEGIQLLALYAMIGAAAWFI